MALGLTACQNPDESSGEVLVIDPVISDMNMEAEQTLDMTVDMTEDMVGSIQLSIQALNPLSNQGIADLEAELVSEESRRNPIVTDLSGQASFPLNPFSSYEVTLQAEGYSPHHLFGELGDQDALQISFVSSDTLTSQVFSALGITPDANKGIVVIGLDRSNLSPAVGTKAELNGAYELAFTLGSFGPSLGQEVISGGGGFVSFANVEPGNIDVLVEPVEGETCAIFPKNESTSFSIPVYAGAVSIVAYTCQSEF